MDFIGKWKIWLTVSLLVIMASLGSLVFKGLNKGIDFVGGHSILIQFNDPLVSVKAVRAAVNLDNVMITDLDKNIIFKTKLLTKDQETAFYNILKEEFGEYEVLESSMIGPSVGNQLRSQSLKIIFITIGLLLIYITFRFEFWYGLAAIIALCHDAIVILGFASFMQLEVNITFVAAILTVLGYSINDTIVVFDRIREESKENKSKLNLAKVANTAIKKTLSRSINTTLTTLFVVVSLVLFGGITIREFSLVILIGIIAGTFSSIFIASPFYVFLKKLQE